jgi:serine/threonine protein kinase
LEQIGKYRILSKIGQGGMGVVYKAQDPKIERVLAVKIISARLDTEPELRSRFRQEARSAAQLSHKNIITIFEYDEEDGLAYLAMEFLDGEDLKTKISDRQWMPLELKLRIMKEVAEGLSHAHKMGVIHRDVKPGNIFITRSGEVKILDFGLARLTTSELTRTGVSMGTPAYMSPEQLRYDRVDHKSDIFSAGVVFYELLTYHKPFHGDSNFSISLKIVDSEPAPVEDLEKSIPPALSSIIRRALEKDPARRYQTMDELLEDLDEVRRNLEERTLQLQREIAEDSGKLEQLLRDHRQFFQTESPATSQTGVIVTSPPAESAGVKADSGRRSGSQLDYLRTLEMRNQTRIELDRLSNSLIKRREASRVLAQAEELVDKGDFRSAQESIDKVLSQDPESTEALFLKERIAEKTAAQARPLTDSYPGEGDATQSPVVPIFEETVEIGKLDRAAGTIPVEPSIPRVSKRPDPKPPAPLETESPIHKAGQDNAASTLLEDRSETPDEPQQARRPMPRGLLWAGAVIILAVLIGGFFILRQNFTAQSDVDAQLASARSMIQQKQYDSAIDLLRQISAAQPANTEAQTLLGDAQRQKEIAGLFDQARDLTGQNRFDEAKVVYDRLLQLDPANSQAAELRRGLESTIAPPPVTGADPQIDSQASLAEIQTLIAANKLVEAQARLDKVLAANPRDPKGLALRKDILTRMEAARRQALKQKESLEASERLAGLERQAETLFREGKYAQLPTALDEWLIADPQSARALQLREQLKELQAQQQRFESAAKIKNPDEGLKALQQIERMNPSDPRLAELRQRLAGEEFKPAPAPAPLPQTAAPARRPPEPFSIPVEHGHVLGKCSGDLRMDGTTLSYKTGHKDHGFTLPLEKLRFTTENNKVTVIDSATNYQVRTFKARDAEQAKSFMQAWERLKGNKP